MWVWRLLRRPAPPDNDDVTQDATEPAPPGVTRVEICTGSHQVTVECDQPWPVVAAAALKLWREVGGPTALPVQTMGFSMPHLSEPVDGPLLGPEFILPHRMQPDLGETL